MCFARAIFFGKKKHGGLDAKMQRCLPKALPDPWHGAQCARSMCSQYVLAVTVVAVPVAWYRLRLLQGLQGMETFQEAEKNRW